MASTPSGQALTTLALLAVLLSGCVTSNGGQGPASSYQSAFVDQIREVDLTPPPRQRVENERTTSKSKSHAAIYNGDGTVATPNARTRTGARSGVPGASVAAQRFDELASRSDPISTGSLPDAKDAKASNKGYEINFENTPVETVAKAILGDILGVGYTIDPRVKGTRHG